MLHNRYPLVTTDPNKLEEQAKSKLPPKAYNYVAGGAGERATMDANRLAFRQWKMVPRMLRPTTHRDLTIELFGEKYGLPLTSLPKSKIFLELTLWDRNSNPDGTNWGTNYLPRRQRNRPLSGLLRNRRPVHFIYSLFQFD
jgi:hypothetical protein